MCCTPHLEGDFPQNRVKRDVKQFASRAYTWSDNSEQNISNRAFFEKYRKGDS